MKIRDQQSIPWGVAAILCAVAFGVQGGFAGLADPDLPMHLALGEWIVQHRAVPVVEPFAWTRAGAPFYAYSWLPEVVFFQTWRAFGPVGLHVLMAATMIAIVAAGMALGHAMKAGTAGALLLGTASAYVALESTPFLRPQLAMFALVPLAWLVVEWLATERYSTLVCALLLVWLNALAANTHISFPVMAAPLALLTVRRAPAGQPSTWRSPWRVRTTIVGGLATIAGWLLSPYGLHWLDVFRLNFATNTLFTMPTVVGEFKPGFTVNLPLGMALAALPIVVAARMPTRERIVAGALWCAGLTVYALVYKGIGPWWWCCTPMVVALLSTRMPLSTPAMHWAFAMVLAAAAASLSISNVRLYASLAPYEKGGIERSLPSLKAFDAEPLAAWLEQHMQPEARGRLLTIFAYGSYMQWRTPSLSESIDGRTIFPDSAALPDAIGRPGVHLGPWHSADVAVVPVNYPVAAVLDTSTEWDRVGVARKAPWSTSASPAGLWLRRSWWARAGRAAASAQTNGVP